MKYDKEYDVRSVVSLLAEARKVQERYESYSGALSEVSEREDRSIDSLANLVFYSKDKDLHHLGYLVGVVSDEVVRYCQKLGPSRILEKTALEICITIGYLSRDILASKLDSAYHHRLEGLLDKLEKGDIALTSGGYSLSEYVSEWSDKSSEEPEVGDCLNG
jgi:hypothetical protein